MYVVVVVEGEDDEDWDVVYEYEDLVLYKMMDFHQMNGQNNVN